MNTASAVCPNCHAPYRNIQHPLKPPGVIMMTVCDCRLVFDEKYGVTNVRLVPPDRDGAP